MPAIGASAVCLFLGDDLGGGFYLGTLPIVVPNTSQGPVLSGNFTVTGSQTVSGDVTIGGSLHGGGIT
ncbi:hypothetical protein SAMN05216312_102210 [Cohnella sp. OV330]|nr:hypothetical protein SAMN05216312_102210 [Cohnella sp. OV330]